MTITITALPRPRDVLDEFGLYVHVPFCSHRCWYCDFNAYASLEHLADAYMDALADDVRRALSAPEFADLDERPTVTSIFIGGGTPTLVDARGIAKVLRAAHDTWTVAPGAEITIECNPESLTAEKLDAYLHAGINRVSIGVQSLDNDLLQRLGRTHDASTALAALRRARDAGFTNVSGDLIYGIPGETDEQWLASVEGVLECEPTHMSCYALTYEEGTPLESWRRLGKVIPVEDDDVARRWDIADELLGNAGLHRYEISNWSKPGLESRHNSLYWRCGEYLGLGAGAHSHLATHGGAVRSWTLRSPERYSNAIAGGSRTLAGHESIDQRTRASEVMLLGLRRPEGVTSAHFEALVGVDLRRYFGPELEHAAARGLIAWDGHTARVVDPLLSNAAVVAFVD
jgi:putative oxygen-independent coproporphyrinogen III oxidase